MWAAKHCSRLFSIQLNSSLCDFCCVVIVVVYLPQLNFLVFTTGEVEMPENYAERMNVLNNDNAEVLLKKTKIFLLDARFSTG